MFCCFATGIAVEILFVDEIHVMTERHENKKIATDSPAAFSAGCPD
jgi:hypothetical protein